MSRAEGLLPGYRGGNGEPLLLLHGVGGQWQVWEPVLRALEQHHELDAPDLPGFGTAPPLDRAHTPLALADAVEAHLEAREWHQPHVVGNSLGGLVALELARRGRAASVTALSPGGMQRGWEESWLQGTLRVQHRVAGSLRSAIPAVTGNPVTRTLALALQMARPWKAGAAWACGLIQAFGDSPTVIDALDHIDDHDTTANLDEIAVAVTIAWGTRDRLLFPRQAPRFLTRLPKGRLVRLDGLGHVPMADDPDLVANVILETTGRA